GPESLSKVNARLVCQTYQHPKHICHFIGQLHLFLFPLKRLLPVAAHHNSRKFAHFLHKDTEIGEFAKIANPNLFNPFIYLLLGLPYAYLFFHYASTVLPNVARYSSSLSVKALSISISTCSITTILYQLALPS